MTRLGLSNETDASASPAFRKNKQNETNEKSQKKRKKLLKPTGQTKHKMQKCQPLIADDRMTKFINCDGEGIELSSESLRTFVTMWKQTCADNTVTGVLKEMSKWGNMSDKERKKVKLILSAYPFVGLLNVAVASIRSGMWDSMYDTLQALNLSEVAQEPSATEYENIEVESDEKDRVTSKVENEHSISVKDLSKKVLEYFQLHNGAITSTTSFLNLLKELCNCKLWLMKQFSVQNFAILGYQDFFMFIEKNLSLLPNVLQKLFTQDICVNHLEVSVLESQLSLLLSQATNNFGNEKITNEMVSVLLRRQFPSVSLTIKGDFNESSDSGKGNSGNSNSSCVLFSACLLGDCHKVSTNEKDLQKSGLDTSIDHEAEVFGRLTTKDVMKVILKSPMLLDLALWTHWDMMYAPSLGHLLEWVLNEVNSKELMFLVTKDGKVIRIDPAATLDSFLKSLLEGSAYKTAVSLLSLFAIYGGEGHIPLRLLKFHAHQAFEVLMKNHTEYVVNDDPSFLMQGYSSFGQGMPALDLQSVHKSKNDDTKSINIASSFVINCLGYLPTEFRNFAAEVLLSELQSIAKDSYTTLLCECRQIGQRVMLHDIGLSLGIVEWIDDYHVFCSSVTTRLAGSETVMNPTSPLDSDKHNLQQNEVEDKVNYKETSEDCPRQVNQQVNEVGNENGAVGFVESIRRKEFGLDPSLSDMEICMLKKQHARLGRALQCLSQELYSQDSHFLLELVQNADDNAYPENVEPTLTVILQEKGIVIMNNEKGFSAENIRALCDVGNSTKKGSNAGYIGKKGIGFKSVFRITDAPEIHSNGFHIKFDISEGQIGFVLPTVIPPCDVNLFKRMAFCDTDETDNNYWKTCIVLPFKSITSGSSSMNNIKSMFSVLHPSLLLFLHRLKCIRFRNFLDDSLTVMRKEIVGQGLVNVCLGKDKMTWFVASQKLQPMNIRPDVLTTEISIAFTLHESDVGTYIPCLDQQPVFAFLPLRQYGLKFIIQGDFTLPSSREEVDGNSPWNQWLRSNFPDLFVKAEHSFCSLPCYRQNLGEAVTAFMSFVPLPGDVQGFFSSLPRLIISKLRSSNCLLLEGNSDDWFPPCKVIRNWNEQACHLLPNRLLHEHLGLGFLDKNIKLSDSLARCLGIEDYGPKVLLKIISSLCYSKSGISSMGLVWLSSLLSSLYMMVFSTSQNSENQMTALDLISNLKGMPLIPLSDGTYSCMDEGTIWIHSDVLHPGSENEDVSATFSLLYSKLRTVSPALFSTAASIDSSCLETSVLDNVTRMLQKLGAQRLSAHDIVKLHVLPTISDDNVSTLSTGLMIEHLAFLMFHLQSSCPNCLAEDSEITSVLYNKALISTNYGYKRPTEVPLHFGKEFGNHIDLNILIEGIVLNWHEVDVAYLNHPVTVLLPDGIMKWREFFKKLGVSDFFQVVSVEKRIVDISPHVLTDLIGEHNLISDRAIIKDWESPELVQLLSYLSSNGDRIRCQFLLESLDILWDQCLGDKTMGYCMMGDSSDKKKMFNSSFLRSLCGTKWLVSSLDNELHYAKNIFCDCDAVRSILGAFAPYAVPKVKSEKLLLDIGLKTKVDLQDILEVVRAWRKSNTTFNASIAQMTNFYSIWSEMSTSSRHQILDELKPLPFIFVPYSGYSSIHDIVPGLLLSATEVYWEDSTGSVNQIKEINRSLDSGFTDNSFCKILHNIYPSLYTFFVKDCGVNTIPNFRDYLQILQKLTSVALPSQSANIVFQIFLKWAEGLNNGELTLGDIQYLKECLAKPECSVLPTVLDKWVSLHSSFGIVCWCDDEKLKKEFKNLENIYFLYFGAHDGNDEETLLKNKLSPLLQALGIPALSEVVTREAVYSGFEDPSFKASLVKWMIPYAQRYIYSLDSVKYVQLKELIIEKLSHLQIVVVEKLHYKNVIKGHNIESKKHTCDCLLEGNSFYSSNSTKEATFCSLFKELARVFTDDSQEGTNLANFLLLIMTLVNSGYTERKIESFVSKQVSKLPDEETLWSLSDNNHTPLSMPKNIEVSTTMDELTAKKKKKPGINSIWPPVDWNTAPGFSSVPISTSRKSRGVGVSNKSENDVVPEEVEKPSPLPADINLPESHKGSEDRVLIVPSTGDHTNAAEKRINRNEFGGPLILNLPTTTPQTWETGRLGESEAFNHFVMRSGGRTVTWVNKEEETGLPYDIVIGEEGSSSKEYIEVKATRSKWKNWFTVSVNEWQCAFEKGESFSIAFVVLPPNEKPQIKLFKNPVKMCKLKQQLQLAVVMAKQEGGSSVT
ncbi:protein NO VEIN-like [Impatiens glandulifera]|uniref:protein NO VEIN-like n=1 Tax=Impatiens glandulifera TaxID=253017 RepID=UPI001FB0BAB4|nr:protein NO VEIN-like [Impatiens glandulifera]